MRIGDMRRYSYTISPDSCSRRSASVTLFPRKSPLERTARRSHRTMLPASPIDCTRVDMSLFRHQFYDSVSQYSDQRDSIEKATGITFPCWNPLLIQPVNPGILAGTAERDIESGEGGYSCLTTSTTSTAMRPGSSKLGRRAGWAWTPATSPPRQPAYSIVGCSLGGQRVRLRTGGWEKE